MSMGTLYGPCSICDCGAFFTVGIHFLCPPPLFPIRIHIRITDADGDVLFDGDLHGQRFSDRGFTYPLTITVDSSCFSPQTYVMVAFELGHTFFINNVAGCDPTPFHIGAQTCQAFNPISHTEIYPKPVDFSLTIPELDISGEPMINDGDYSAHYTTDIHLSGLITITITGTGCITSVCTFDLGECPPLSYVYGSILDRTFALVRAKGCFGLPLEGATITLNGDYTGSCTTSSITQSCPASTDTNNWSHCQIDLSSDKPCPGDITFYQTATHPYYLDTITLSSGHDLVCNLTIPNFSSGFSRLKDGYVCSNFCGTPMKTILYATVVRFGITYYGAITFIGLVFGSGYCWEGLLSDGYTGTFDYTFCGPDYNCADGNWTMHCYPFLYTSSTVTVTE